MKQNKNFMDKLLSKPADKLKVVARILMISIFAVGLFYGLLFIFRGRIVETWYNPIEGTVDYVRQKDLTSGLVMIFGSAAIGWLLGIFIGAYANMVDDLKRLRKTFTEEVHDEYEVITQIQPLMTGKEISDVPVDKEATIKLYESIPSVGPKTAEMLFEEFSDNLGKTVKENPALLDKVRGLTDKNREELSKFFNEE